MIPEAGFKTLTRENFLRPDESTSAFVWRQPTEGVRPQTAEEWARMILGITLNDSVPKGVRDLFSVAQGAMLYGYFFYPLYTLATEQLFRVAETAIGEKAVELGTPRSRRTFEARLTWLVEAGAIEDDEIGAWHALRGLRNSASHPVDQTILMPTQALSMLTRLVEMIQHLF